MLLLHGLSRKRCHLKRMTQSAATQQKTNTAPLATFAVLLVLFTTGVGQSFVFTSIPPIGREIGLSETAIGFAIGFGAAVFVVFSFLWGKAINVFGVRRTMQVGMVTFFVTTTLLGVVLHYGLEGGFSPQTTLYLTMALRGLFSVGAAGLTPAAQAYFVSTSTPEKRTAAIANLTISIALGMICGPAIAAVLSTIDLVLPFYFAGGLAVVAVTILTLCMPPLARQKAPPDTPKIKWLGHPVLPLFGMSMMLVFCSTGLQQVVLFYVQDMLALTAVEAAQQGGSAMTIMSFSSVIIQIGVVKRVQWRPYVMIYLGVALYLVAMLCLLLLKSFPGILTGLAIFGMGTAFLFPAISAKQTLVAQEHEQGAIAGANASALGLGMTVGPFVCAALYQVSISLPFFLIAAVSASMGLFYSFMRKTLVDA